MINRVRDQLGPEPEPDESAPKADDGLSKHAKLFGYLLGLAGNLPPTRDEEFRQSEERLKLMGVQARLSGHATLRSRAAESAGQGTSPEAHRASHLPRPSDTFDYLARLSGDMPDPDVGGQLSERARRVSEHLRSVDR